MDLKQLTQSARQAAGTEKKPALRPIDFAEIIKCGIRRERPSVAKFGERPEDGLFYKGRVNEIHGLTSVGKSNILYSALILEIKDGGIVVVIDPEDTPLGFFSRIVSLSGNDPEIIKAIQDGRIKYFQAPEPDDIKNILDEVGRPTLIIFDGLAELLASAGMSEDKAADILCYFKTYIRPFAEKLGSAVVVADHTTKTGGDKNGARGSYSKQGRYDGISYRAELGQAYTPDTPGYVKLLVQKDRNGGTGKNSQETHVEIYFSPNGSCDDYKPESDAEGIPLTKVEFRKPGSVALGENVEKKPTVLMDRIVDHIKTNKTAKASDLLAICGKHKNFVWATDCLLKEGTIKVQDGPRGSKIYSMK